MGEENLDTTPGVPEKPEPVGNWHIPAEEIKAMDSEQFRDFVIDLHQRTARLYDLEMMRALRDSAQKPISKADIGDILNPENTGQGSS